ncbi:MAG: DNA-3-methyladenine glycosylase 2 family protein [Planctomycetota bacterium]
MKPTPAQLRTLRRRDPALARVMPQLPPYPGFPDAMQHRYRSHFHALARAILFQQIAGSAARAILKRVCALTPGPHFPKAPELLALSDAKLRGAGLSVNKVAALRDLAAHVVDGRLRLRGAASLGDDEIIERLVQVRGIGLWTAQMFLMFRIGRLDVMPATDLAVQEGLRRLDGLAERPTPTAALARAAVWAPLRSVGAWFMWRLSDVDEATAEG